MIENGWKSFFKFSFPELFKPNAQFSHLSIFKPTATAELNVYSTVTNFKSSPYKDNTLLNRALGCTMGNVIGDSLGSVMEFTKLDYSRNVIHDFHPYYFMRSLDIPEVQNSFGLKVGQHTDDSAMALCLYDSLLASGGLNCVDLRHRFLRWWTSGYNNGFRFDGTPRNSVGLGGNISYSLMEILTEGVIEKYTKAGNPQTSGNGSIMRMSGAPLFYHNNLKEAIEKSGSQSRTTHQGEEAADCCRVMAFIIVKAVHSSEVPNAKVFLDSLDMSELLPHLKTEGGKNLALSKREEKIKEATPFCQGPEDRDWNWKSPSFRYSPTRASENPHYIGSYAMDGLSMALHCVYSTQSFTEALLKVVNMGGDADTTGAIAGQVAGAIYGIDSVKPLWSHYIMQWDNQGEIPLRAICCVLPELREKVIDPSALVKTL